MNCPNPKCGGPMLATYRVEDDRGHNIIMRRALEYNECENMECGVVVVIIQPFFLKEHT